MIGHHGPQDHKRLDTPEVTEHACRHVREESREEEGVSYIVSRACKTGQDGLAKKEEWAGSVGGCYRVHMYRCCPTTEGHTGHTRMTRNQLDAQSRSKHKNHAGSMPTSTLC